jgi:hypothetical protein
MAFFWLRRAWRSQVRHDHSEVALKHGEPPPDVARWARWEMLINLVAGLAALYVILSVAAGLLPYDSWTAIAGTTVWSKFFASFALSRQAHGAAARSRSKP